MPTYTNPSTWADGTIVTSTFMNVEVKQNIEYLGTTHRHSTGTLGEGAGYIGPITFLDAKGAAVPDAPADSTVTRVFATATAFGWQSSGSVVQYFADTLHEHAISNVSYGTVETTDGATVGGGAVVKAVVNPLNTAALGTLATAITVGGSGSRSINIVGGGMIANQNPGTSKIRAELRDDGVIFATADRGANDSAGTAAGAMAWVGTILTDVPAGSVTYSMTYRLSTDTTTNFARGYANFLEVREIRQS